MLSISQKRIRHLKQLMSVSGLHEIAPETACNSILSYASSKPKSTPIISLTDFQNAARDILGIKELSEETEEHRSLMEVLTYIFAGFDIQGNGSPSALEVACGFLVLCRGKKSDKLEYAFEVLDYDKKGHLSREEMHIYMRSFLTVLLGIACSPTLETDEVEDSLTMMNGEQRCERTTPTIIKAVDAGSKWAVAQSLKRRNGNDKSTFDSFAEWYTEEGHISIPWVELLTLQKWVL
jgi:Ca2+-binding EF-hand superfamily protein